MQFDDRLATVLRMHVDSKAGTRTQFRQLLDLLGTASADDQASAAFARLDELRGLIPATEQAQILREPGLRLRNPALVQFLAEGDPKTAASAVATARLTEAEWEALIPRLSITARGFLRHRRDLPAGALRQLERLGVGDLVLSDDRDLPAADPAFSDTALPGRSAPPRPPRPADLAPAPPPQRPPRPANPASEPISDIIERIEQFRTARRIPVLAPRLPLGDAAPSDFTRIEAFDAITDAQGRATWASAGVAPWIVGMALTSPRPGALVQFSAHTATALRHRQPLSAQLITISGAPAISGDWRIEAAPIFAPDSGAFCGYRCRLMRAIAPRAANDQPDSYADRMRQVLHELRTPVNAIQGFAEIIQQQLFGAVPHEYRAHAAAIAVDSAKLLAGFDEIERLAQLESGAANLEAGEADLRVAVAETLRRLERVLTARNAGFDLTTSGEIFTTGIAQAEAMALCWRLLASASGALAPDERATLNLGSDATQITLELSLPASLQTLGDTPRPASNARAAVSAGMFGPQFAFRLAAAEARAAGGSLNFVAQRLVLTLPVLTPSPIAHSNGQMQAGN